MADGLSDSQLKAMAITERLNSSLSVVGIFFVVLTFGFSHHFNKPINRLIFFASFGNVGSNIASLISSAGPLSVATGELNSPLCKFQAFLVQMFLGVDVYWAFCMAINVYLVFFRGFTIAQLRKLDIWYLLACYGLAFIPALTFLFINTKVDGSHGGPVYGPAIIWCWISPNWDWMRIVFLYGIVWLAMIFAFVVYAMAGKVIWDKRRHLDGFLNPLNENPFTNTITTEIEITHEERFIVKDPEESPSNAMNDIDQYSVKIQVEPPPSRPLPAALRMRTLTRDVAELETNAESWLYARVAVLFFIALLITWVPTSVNRVYALAKPNVINFPLNYVSSFVFPLQGFVRIPGQAKMPCLCEDKLLIPCAVECHSTPHRPTTYLIFRSTTTTTTTTTTPTPTPNPTSTPFNSTRHNTTPHNTTQHNTTGRSQGPHRSAKGFLRSSSPFLPRVLRLAVQEGLFFARASCGGVIQSSVPSAAATAIVHRLDTAPRKPTKREESRKKEERRKKRHSGRRTAQNRPRCDLQSSPVLLQLFGALDYCPWPITTTTTNYYYTTTPPSPPCRQAPRPPHQTLGLLHCPSALHHHPNASHLTISKPPRTTSPPHHLTTSAATTSTHHLHYLYHQPTPTPTPTPTPHLRRHTVLHLAPPLLPSPLLSSTYQSLNP
ncbi:hypothetical protein B7494_g5063 [Chlorociboria aeruginascens]|nr:hypothetical protein B7494_g5063 [Chlorociboria aeruginascens]